MYVWFILELVIFLFFIFDGCVYLCNHHSQIEADFSIELLPTTFPTVTMTSMHFFFLNIFNFMCVCMPLQVSHLICDSQRQIW